jgi:hypothetical protein
MSIAPVALVQMDHRLAFIKTAVRYATPLRLQYGPFIIIRPADITILLIFLN